MPSYSGGGSPPIPDVAGDNQTPGGLTIKGAVAAALQGLFYQAGSDAQGNAYCGTLVADPSSDTGNPVIRGTQPSTFSADTADFRNDLGHGLHVRSNGQTSVSGAELLASGGFGMLGHAAMATPRTLAQATINAITDANAKTAVQACANALSDMGALTLT